MRIINYIHEHGIVDTTKARQVVSRLLRAADLCLWNTDHHNLVCKLNEAVLQIHQAAFVKLTRHKQAA